MRPYSGIGVLATDQTTGAIPLYDEPGLIRCCSMELSSSLKIYSGIFSQTELPYLLVFAARDNWFRVDYDEAGRQGWIETDRHWSFHLWPDFLKGKSVTFLRNSPKKYLLLTLKAGDDAGVSILHSVPMRIIMVQDDWAFVIIAQQQSGWIRWRDPDGRLLVSINCSGSSAQNR